MILRAVLTVFLILTMTLKVNADEYSERQEIFQQGLFMIVPGELSSIEKTTRDYRENEERFESGVWKLWAFYYGFSRDVAIALNNGDVDLFDEKTAEFLRQFPNSAAAVIMRAQFLRRYAWQLRGGGYARDIPPINMMKHRKALRETVEFLIDHKILGDTDPGWYEVLIDAYFNLGEVENALAIFEEGIEKFPKYYSLYFKVMGYLSPSWHGDRKLQENFVNYAVEQTQDFEGTSMYARMYWSATGTIYFNGNLFTESLVDWEKMKQAMFDVLERYPAEWNYQNFAYFSCLKGDAEMTRQMFEQVKARPIPGVWERGLPIRDCWDLAGL